MIEIGPLKTWLVVLAMQVAARPLQLVLLACAVLFGWLLGPVFAVPSVIMIVLTEVFPRGSDEAVEVSAATEPGLHAVVSDLAAQMNVTAPIAVRITPGVDASIHRRRSGRSTTLVLDLGLPMVMTLSKEELVAVAAHELAHARDLDSAHRHLNAARRRLEDSQRAPVLGAALLRSTAAEFRHRELRADDVASAVAGAQSLASALHRTAQLNEAFETLVDHWTDVLADEGEYPADLFDALPLAIADPATSDWLDRGVRMTERLSLDDEESGHPTDDERRTHLGADGRGRRTGEPVALSGQETLAAWAVKVGFDVDDDDPRRPGLILGSPEGRFDFHPGSAHAALREATLEPLLRSALLRVAERIDDGRWPELADSVEPELLDAPPGLHPDLRRIALSNCVGTALVVPLLRAGCTRANPWLRYLISTPSGEPINVHTVVWEALDTARTAELRALIEMADLGAGS